jgi:Uma2 family endonuclease
MTVLAEPLSEKDPDRVPTAADLLEKLGVPPERIWFVPMPGHATEADVLYADTHLNRLCELVDNTLVEKAVGNSESLLAVIISSILWEHVRSRKLGWIFGADGMFRLIGGNVRLPDIAFVSFSRMSQGVLEPVSKICPNLAVEVLSASNTVTEIRRKRQEYFSSGVELGWIVDPIARTVAVYNESEKFALKQLNETLDGGSVLPGFSVQLSEIFAPLDSLTSTPE